MTVSNPKMYGQALMSLWEGRIDLAVDPMYLMLVGAGYVPNVNTHKFKSVVSNEIIGSGYAAGGKQIQGAAVSYNSSTKKLTLTGSTVAWPEVAWTDARYMVAYMSPAGFADTLKPLVFYVDLGVNSSPVDKAFYAAWSANGILRMTIPL